ELTRQLDRQVSVTLSGEDTEMDRVILDSLKSPLSHLLRNAVDHGLESPAERIEAGKPALGTLSLRAGQEGNRIVIQVSDDGRGIDPDKVRRLAVERGVLDGASAAELSDEEVVQLIFASGFSTKEGVTQISGRGVGMDAVRRAVEELKGDVLVQSQVGAGTTITIRLPLTLLISRVMLMRSAGQRFALPTESVEESVRVNSYELITLSERPALEWRGETLRILHLTEFLGQPVLPDPEYLRVLIVRHGKDRLALVVEELLEERSVVVKPLGWPLDELPWLSGAVQDPSGEIALQLHVPRLFERSRGVQRAPRRRRQSRSVLVVDDSLVSRQKLGRSLEALGFDPIVAVDGMDALGLLERIKPLLILTDIEMPRLDGFALVRRVRARPKLAGVPVVIVSNRGSEQDREAGLQAGADAYLPKSEFSTANLRETLERLL
ncbi:MAG TPA: hybrid sensor histidine kinase/response regulator, partial [Planctomycetes bacterium]|nr:hybrid sensor histidine kinase/response regulator [Planctomycetota bacterium]